MNERVSDLLGKVAEFHAQGRGEGDSLTGCRPGAGPLPLRALAPPGLPGPQFPTFTNEEANPCWSGWLWGSWECL